MIRKLSKGSDDMDDSNYQEYKIARTISEQIEYLNKNKRVQSWIG